MGPPRPPASRPAIPLAGAVASFSVRALALERRATTFGAPARGGARRAERSGGRARSHSHRAARLREGLARPGGRRSRPTIGPAQWTSGPQEVRSGRGQCLATLVSRSASSTGCARVSRAPPAVAAASCSVQAPKATTGRSRPARLSARGHLRSRLGQRHGQQDHAELVERPPVTIQATDCLGGVAGLLSS